MKKYLPSRLLALLVAGFCFCNAVKAQYVTIPDTVFATWLQNNGFGTCMNGNQLDTTCSVVLTTGLLRINGLPIRNLSGIQYFKALENFDCSNDSIYSIPALPDSITTFNCAFNNLSSMPALGNVMQIFGCNNNQLISLPSLPTTLFSLLCYSNSLTALPALPDGLLELNCGYNLLTSLPVLPQTLTYANCSFNPLNALGVLPDLLQTLLCAGDSLATLPALPASLIYLSCEQNQLTALPDLPNADSILWCYSNLLTSLPALPPQLNTLNCSENRLTALPALPAKLQYLICGTNLIAALPSLPDSLQSLNCAEAFLTTLPPIPATVTTLVCSNNQLTSVPELPDSLNTFNCANNASLACLPQLKRIVNLDFSHTAVTCLPDYGSVTSSTPALSTVPLCGIFNPAGCGVYWDISGLTYYDVDNNCAFDSSDVGQNNVKVLLDSSGVLTQQVFTGGQGYYSFLTGNGNYTITVDTSDLPFTLECPGNDYLSARISPADSLSYSYNFAFKCRTEGFDIGVTSIMYNVNSLPQPGRAIEMDFIAGDISQLYGANCASGISGQVQVIYDGPLTYLSAASGSLTPLITGDTLTYAVADFGNLNDYAAFNSNFRIDSGASTNAAICFTVNVTPAARDFNPSNNTLNYCFPVLNSYDPNEKQVYPTSVDSAGQWLTYTIRFQNTGTAPAINIIVKDTLDPNLDPSTFQLLAYSAPTMTQIFGNVVDFNFPNVNLPDSTTSDSLSRGYVQYRIKTISNLQPGSVISNTASIYFDSNPAVVTNTVVDSVADSIVCAPNSANLSQTICSGDSTLIGSLAYYATGVYTDTLTNVNGCDSIVTLNLTVDTVPPTNLYDTTCSNTAFVFYSNTLTQSGTYTDTLQSSSGCDSFIVLNLLVLPAVTDTVNETICWDQTYNNYDTSGQYIDTFTSVNGCDSIRLLKLSVIPVEISFDTAVICQGQSYLGYTATGNYTDTITAINSCDKITNLNLTVLPVSISDTAASITCGDSVIIAGLVFKLSGTYSDTLTSVNGCDSIITLQLTVTGGDTTYLSDTICANNSLLFNGTHIDTMGTYTANYTSVAGCDSMVVLQLLVAPLAFSDTAVSISCGDSITFGSNVYKVSGTFRDTVNASNGCDSIITLQLSVIYDTTYLVDTICANETFIFNGTNERHSGTYTAHEHSVNGCDSTVILNLTVKPLAYSDTIITATCPDSVIYWGNVYHLSGTYYDSLPGSNGCDSVAILHVIIQGNDTSYTTDTICNGDSVLYNNIYQHTTGKYTEHYTAVGGCDSAVILELYVRPASGVHTTLSTTCGSYIAFDNHFYHLNGLYTDTFTNIYGCDSINSLKLTLIGGDTTYVSDTICANDTLFFNGAYLDVSGSYTTQYTTETSCDSTVFLQLTVKPSVQVTFTWDSLFVAGDVLDTFVTSASWCNGMPPVFLLKGGNPPGGHYSGFDITNDSLNAAAIVEYYNYPPFYRDSTTTITYTYTDTDGCSPAVQVSLAIGVCEGVQTIAPNNLFNLYPNPAGDYTMIAISPDAIGSTMKLLDVTGKELITMKLTATPQRLPLSTLSAGVYMVVVETGGLTGVKLLVKTE